jgi:hypothetical protein
MADLKTYQKAKAACKAAAMTFNWENEQQVLKVIYRPLLKR